MSSRMIEAVLFDLDGTLADTAPDLGYAINQMRATRGLAPLPLAVTRPVTSMGARGMLETGLSVTPAHPHYDALREEFLGIYADNICRDSCLFPGMAELLVELEQRAMLWGVVTNKPERFTHPLLEHLGIHDRAACIIGGDTTGRIKPDPAPLLAASERINIAPRHCLYLGDDIRDIQAGRAAGMRVVVAGFGYLNGTDPATWGADATIDTPLDLLRHI
jgi:N-acetyl-D-muramate 6-phosphate phosphatase